MADYYLVAKKASQTIADHPGLLYLKEKAQKAEKILDVGCGEGTRLNTILPQGKSAAGVDINKKAINQAQQQYPRHKFYLSSADKLPFKDNFFDLIYTAFVLEHTSNPQKLIEEMLRVLKTKGLIIVLCPNYGAPNRRSPNSIETPLFKLLLGFLKDFLPSGRRALDWTKVKPKREYSKIDDDTTIEPYVLTLKRYLKLKGFKLLEVSSLWSLEEKSLNPRKLLFFALGQLKVFPFKYWGPQIFIAASKQ